MEQCAQGDTGDPVGVLVGFWKGKMYPKKLIWRGREITLTRTFHQWKESESGEVHFGVGVTDGTSSYELRFDSRHLAWRLIRINEVVLGAEG